MHEAVYEYIKQYPKLNSFLNFNSIEELHNATGLNTVYGDEEIKEYTSGTKKKKYDFAIVQMMHYDNNISDINIDNIQDVQEFMEWIKKQNKIKNFPDLGENKTVISIENLQDMPNLAEIYTENIAKYMFQCRIIYIEEE